MNNLAIIPARGGSKRIPRKNIRNFLGKPIIAYSIETAINSGLFKEVMVSTDDKEIAKVAKQYGATIPFMRSNKNADDFATLNDVFLEVENWYKQNGRIFDAYCLILPTAPLITVELLKKGAELLISSVFDSVRPVVRFGYPIQRAVKLEDGKISFFYPEFYKSRSQDLEPSFHDAGMFYFIMSGKSLIDENKGGLKIEETYAQDIDSSSDWEFAEIKYNHLHKNSN